MLREGRFVKREGSASPGFAARACEIVVVMRTGWLVVVIAACSSEPGTESTVDANGGDGSVIDSPPSCFGETGRIEAVQVESGNAFGDAIAIDGTTAAIGASGEDVATIRDRGAVYLLARTGGTWMHDAKLTGEALADRFGDAVAIRGGVLLVGAPNNDGSPGVIESGSAYVYERDGSGAWQPAGKLRASTPVAFAGFGSTVALLPGTAFVAAPTEAGAVYVFERSAGGVWSETAKLVPSDPQAKARFGHSLAANDTTLVVGLGHDPNMPTTGGAYVFEKQGSVWTEVKKLQVASPASGTQLGHSVAIEGTTIFVGAPASAGAMPTGAVEVFERDATGWHHAAQLHAADPQPFDYFGSSVSISGDRALIGATLEDGPDGMKDVAGAAYEVVRTASGWAQAKKHHSSDLAENGKHFGHHSAVASKTALVGGSFYRSGLPHGGVYALDCP